eukprot:scaffold5935_cov237-Amphora_coffeaeformis.AAC.1
MGRVLLANIVMYQLQVFRNGFSIRKIRPFLRQTVTHQVFFNLQHIGTSFVNGIENWRTVSTQPCIPRCSHGRNVRFAACIARGGSIQMCLMGQIEEAIV